MNERKAMKREQVRAVDRFAIEALGLPGVVLMENAGAGVAQYLVQREARRVLIVCGKGNNGGDGYVIARRLTNAGVAVQVVSTTSEPLSGDAGVHQAVWRQAVAHDPTLTSSDAVGSWESADAAARERLLTEFQPDWIVDAMLGTGARGPARSPVAEVLTTLNAADARRLAVDVPSGMDCDTGEVQGEGLRADVTCSFVAPKFGFLKAEHHWLGEVVVLGIGAPQSAIQFGYAQDEAG